MQQVVMHAPVVNSIMRAILENSSTFLTLLKSG